MHIPDGFLDTKTWVTLDIVSAGFLGISVVKVKNYLDERKFPLMGVMAAFIFAAQMLNFPVGGGTSGHFMGGVIASILLGPWGGCLVMSSVLIVQCFLFQDGGLTVLGANIFNMGVIGSTGGYYIYLAISKIIEGRKGILAGAFVASWCSIVLASVACAMELALSGRVSLIVVLPAMVIVHAFIGAGEAIITVSALSFLLKIRPDLLEQEVR
ncbi:MAG: energy-coupling factor ABC transporter permease [Candidatus Eremiobacterota bacterium]